MKYDTKLGETINSTLPYISPLLTYSIEFEQMLSTWKQMKNNVQVKQVIKQAEETIGPQPLEQLLIQPVQRVMRYPMLINELIKSTSVYHCDYSFLQMAYSGFHKFSQLLNDRMKLYDNTLKIVTLHNVKDLLIEGRFHLMTYQVEYTINDKTRKQTLELFNDIICLFDRNNQHQLLKKKKITSKLSFQHLQQNK